MNIKRLLLAILAGWVVVFATDFLIHELWLAPVYAATKPLWRPESDMPTYFCWILVAQFLIVTTFVIVWARGFAERSIGAAVSLRPAHGSVSANLGHHFVCGYAGAGRAGGQVVRCWPCPSRLAWHRNVSRLQTGAICSVAQRNGGDPSIAAAFHQGRNPSYIFFASCSSRIALRMSSCAFFIASNFSCCCGVSNGRICAPLLSRITRIFSIASW